MRNPTENQRMDMRIEQDAIKIATEVFNRRYVSLEARTNLEIHIRQIVGREINQWKKGMERQKKGAAAE